MTAPAIPSLEGCHAVAGYAKKEKTAPAIPSLEGWHEVPGYVKISILNSQFSIKC